MTSSGERPRQTPLQVVHERLGASMTSFAGWQMPLRYGSETAEHHAVRRAAGLFDLSHMGEIVVAGPGAGTALDYALTGHLSALRPGRARYTMICAEDGGVLDDLVVYRQDEDEFLVIANAANTDVVLAQLRDRASGREARVTDATGDYALVAIQGPAAAGILAPLAASLDLAAIKYYAGAFGEVAGRKAWVARTGYTGEDGFEVFCRPEDAEPIWSALVSQGAPAGLVPAGLAARDTLRLEAGMPLYGNELGPDVTPFEAGLGRVVKFDKPGDFVGRLALAARASEGPRRRLAGLTMKSRRIARHGYAVLADGVVSGVVTSGAPSPTLGVPIAMAYLELPALKPGGGPALEPGAGAALEPGAGPALEHAVELAVDVRGDAVPAEMTDLPFYRRSK
ncbi:MAG TPA: glycine cleavage system aminomethyltransferase GcvT [Streptosporangiaceae bacterium]|nr:glycine cleavage system aminomethyltransferase GcvT [Streptosporangiaceae bacterium]